jgi:hypothetical protein
VWAAAEWVMMIRNCFLREEQDRLILGSGIPAPWLVPGQNLRFGPAPCSFGTVTVTVHTQPATRKTTISWDADWHGQPPPIEIRLPSFAEYHPKHGESSVELEALS